MGDGKYSKTQQGRSRGVEMRTHPLVRIHAAAPIVEEAGVAVADDP